MTTFVWMRNFQGGREQQEKGHKDWGYLSTSAKRIPDWERLTFEDETLIPLRWVYWSYPDNILFRGQLRPKFYNAWNLKWKRSLEKNCSISRCVDQFIHQLDSAVMKTFEIIRCVIYTLLKKFYQIQIINILAVWNVSNISMYLSWEDIEYWRPFHTYGALPSN